MYFDGFESNFSSNIMNSESQLNYYFGFRLNLRKDPAHGEKTVDFLTWKDIVRHREQNK